METIGTINERGLINNFFKKGFEPHTCVSELIGNSIDAGATECKIMHVMDNSGDKLLILDDGKGMDRDGLQKMLDIYGENHSGETSIGTCGVGMKAATVILCDKKGEAMIYTKQKNGKYYFAYIPVGEIFARGRWSGMIKSDEMAAEDIEEYKLLREKLGITQEGTTIILPWSNAVDNVIEDNMSKYEKEFSQKFGVIYSKFETKIKFVNKQQQVSEFPKYRYFDPLAEYYCKLYKYTIYVVKNNDNLRFICHYDEKYMEVLPYGGKKYRTKPEEVDFNPSVSNVVGKFTLHLGQRKDATYFNEENPILPTELELGQRAKKKLYLYDAEFFDEDSDYVEYLSKPFLVRNNQIISSFDIGHKKGSERASAEQMHKIYHVRMEMCYTTDSSQTNIMDDITSIQENKNQNSKNFHVPLVRLLEYMKNEVHLKIWKHFQSVCANKNQVAEEEVLSDSSNSEREVVFCPSNEHPVVEPPIVQTLFKETVDTEPLVTEPLVTEPLPAVEVTSEPVETVVQNEKDLDSNSLLEEREVSHDVDKKFYTKSEVFSLLTKLKSEEHKSFLIKIVNYIAKVKSEKNAVEMFSILPNKFLVEMISKVWGEKDDEEELVPVELLLGIESISTSGSFSFRSIFGL